MRRYYLLKCSETNSYICLVYLQIWKRNIKICNLTSCHLPEEHYAVSFSSYVFCWMCGWTAYRTSLEKWHSALAPALGPLQGSEEAAGPSDLQSGDPRPVWSLQCLVLDAGTTNTPSTKGWVWGAAMLTKKEAPVLCPSAFPRSPPQSLSSHPVIRIQGQTSN